MNHEIKETLPIGKGSLVATKSSYHIQFYFPGPDRRYSGTLLLINSDQINTYILALKNNWAKYQKLNEIRATLGKDFSMEGEMNMKIYIGGYFEGVCIKDYHMPIKNEVQLILLINSFNWAQKRGPEVMALLKSL